VIDDPYTPRYREAACIIIHITKIPAVFDFDIFSGKTNATFIHRQTSCRAVRVTFQPRPPAISITNALLDRNLLGAAIREQDSWATWRIILKAAFAEPLTADELITFKDIAGDREPPTDRVAELWVIAGRRGGKSRTAGAVCAYLAAFNTHKLAPGETATVLSLAASKSQAKAVLDYTLGFLSASPMLKQLLDGEATSEEIRLKGNISIATHSANFRTVRSRTLIGCVFDECSYWRDAETSSNPDSEIYTATLPALATTGGMLIGISSPYRRAGLLYRKHEASFGINDPNVLVVKASSLRLNPTIDPSAIARAREMDPEAARSEWDAEWRTDIADFISRRAVMACVESGVHERPFERAQRYVGFCDPSGGSADSMTLAIAHKVGDTAVLDCLREIKPPFNPESVVSEFCTLLKSYRIAGVISDRYGGEWVASQFRLHGIHLRPSERTKSELFLDALPLINANAVALLDNERMINQLCSLERRTSRSGKDAVDHPPGSHDDLANAAAGALVNVPSAARINRNPNIMHESASGYSIHTGRYNQRTH
jgi:hypothetical protein